MSHNNTVMNELIKLIPRHEFEKSVRNEQADRYAKKFKSWHQLIVLLYSQISSKESLREIEQGLQINGSKLYHLGIPEIKRSTLAEGQSRRNYQIFEKLFYQMLERCQHLAPKHNFKFKNILRSLDATIIDLCLSTFQWARFRKAKGGIKLHCQINHNGHIPEFMTITEAKRHEVREAQKNLSIIPDSIYCFDRGYYDFQFYRRINEKKAFFVTRAKDNLDYVITGQHKQGSQKMILSDEVIKLKHPHYTEPLRLIRFFDEEKNAVLSFLTNNFRLAARTITAIYKSRWQIEIFFKWIKQNLKIKTFLGTSKNAVMSQIWVAMCYYLLLAYIKFQTRFNKSLTYLHKIIKEVLMERFALIDLLRSPPKGLNSIKLDQSQLSFW